MSAPERIWLDPWHEVNRAGDDIDVSWEDGMCWTSREHAEPAFGRPEYILKSAADAQTRQAVREALEEAAGIVKDFGRFDIMGELQTMIARLDEEESKAVIALKACPFCGDKRAAVMKTARVFCVECSRCGGRSGQRLSPEDAATAWNQRSDADEPKP